MIKQLKTLVLAIGLVAGLGLASASFAAKPKEAAPAAAPAAAAPAPEAAAPAAPAEGGEAAPKASGGARPGNNPFASSQGMGTRPAGSPSPGSIPRPMAPRPGGMPRPGGAGGAGGNGVQTASTNTGAVGGAGGIGLHHRRQLEFLQDGRWRHGRFGDGFHSGLACRAMISPI